MGPWMIESVGLVFTLVDLGEMLLFASAVAPPVVPTCAWNPSRCPGSRSFQIIGES